MGIIEIILLLIFGYAFIKVGLTEYPELFFAIVVFGAIIWIVKKKLLLRPVFLQEGKLILPI